MAAGMHSTGPQTAPKRNRKSMIVQELRKLQEDSGYVTQEGLRELSESLGEPLHRLHEVASFFPHFRLTPAPKVEVLVCRDMACHLRGAKACRAALDQTAAELNSKVSTDSDRVEVRGVSCLGRCDSPVAVSINDSIFAGQSIEELRALVTKAHSGATLHAPKPDRSPRPWKIDPYTGKPEYAALRAFIDQWKAFIKEHPEARSKKPSEVLGDEQSPPARLLAELKAANLRGMGGAGFPAVRKMEVRRQSQGQRHRSRAAGPLSGTRDRAATAGEVRRLQRRRKRAGHVQGPRAAAAVSAPGARGHDPRRPQVGASTGLRLHPPRVSRPDRRGQRGDSCCPRARPLRAKHSGRRPFIRSGDVFVSPGGYICGEQNALLEAMEDRRAEPRNKPPSISVEGLRGKPTVINNVETLAWVPAIATNGGKWYPDQGVRGGQRPAARLHQRRRRPAGRLRGAVRPDGPRADC